MTRGKQVVVIGGATVDIDGFVENALVRQTSNPGTIHVSVGGVARNVAENLVRLGVDTTLIAALGDDLFGKYLLDKCLRTGIGVERVHILRGYGTALYMAAYNPGGEMELAVSQLDAVEALSPELLERDASIIRAAEVVVLDTNLSRETIAYLLTEFPETDFFVDPVSVSKAEKVKGMIGQCHTIKPNHSEAAVLSGKQAGDTSAAEDMVRYLVHAGVEQVFISMGNEGVCFGDRSATARIAAPDIKIVSDSGAGDAFMAGLVYAHLNGLGPAESARLATAVAAVTLSHKNTVHPDLSADLIKKTMRSIE